MERMGYTCEMYGCGNHDVYSKPPTLEFEIHRSLFGEDAVPLFYHYYENIMDRTVQQGCACRMTDEDVYLYLLCHTYRHYIYSGTGLRSLLDVYVFLRAHADLDRGYLAGELEQLQLTEFEKAIRELSEKVFTGVALTASDRKALDYYIRSGCYGTSQLAENNRIARGLASDDSRRSKLRYLKDRVFISGEALRMCYPFVAKHKALYPLLLIYRPVRGAVRRPKEIIEEMKVVRRYRREDDA